MKRGFSLVELSIVLVIIGLLTGGILVGQSLIRASQLRAVARDASAYVTAINTFSLKYDALPGDLTDATRYWGVAAGDGSGNDAACRNASQTGQGTCNGNGDGRIRSTDSNVTYSEQFHAWKQLANDELIAGQFTGKTGGGGAFHAVPNTNVPTGSLENSGYSFWNATHNFSDANWFPTEDGNVLFFGTAITSGVTSGVALRSSEQADIDTKLDDGMPATGRVRTYKNNTSCVTSTDPATAKYVKTGSVLACNSIVRIDSGS